MKVLLLANQPEPTIRLKLFGETLTGLGYEVIIPLAPLALGDSSEVAVGDSVVAMGSPFGLRER